MTGGGRLWRERLAVGRCPHCGKLSYPTRRVARSMPDGSGLNVYRCEESAYWHLGHLPGVVRRGALPRSIVRRAGR